MGKVFVMLCFVLLFLVLCMAEMQLNTSSCAGNEEGCFHGSNGATEKPFEALAEMVFNLKEKSFWSERMHSSLWAGVG